MVFLEDYNTFSRMQAPMKTDIIYIIGIITFFFHDAFLEKSVLALPVGT